MFIKSPDSVVNWICVKVFHIFSGVTFNSFNYKKNFTSCIIRVRPTASIKLQISFLLVYSALDVIRFYYNKAERIEMKI